MSVGKIMFGIREMAAMSLEETGDRLAEFVVPEPPAKPRPTRTISRTGTQRTSSREGNLMVALTDAEMEMDETKLSKREVAAPILMKLESRGNFRYDSASKVRIMDGIKSVATRRSKLITAASGEQQVEIESSSEEDSRDETESDESSNSSPINVVQRRWVESAKQPKQGMVRSKVPMLERPRGLKQKKEVPMRWQASKQADRASRKDVPLRDRRRGALLGPSSDLDLHHHPPVHHHPDHHPQESPGLHSNKRIISFPSPPRPTDAPRVTFLSPGERQRLDMRQKREQLAVQTFFREQQRMDLTMIMREAGGDLEHLQSLDGEKGYFLRLFTARRVKRIIGTACINVQRKMSRRRKKEAEREGREKWAGKLLYQAWRRYRLRSFGWRLINHLQEHRARQAMEERKETYMFRLRAAYRQLEEAAAIGQSGVYKAMQQRREERQQALSLQEQMKEHREQEEREEEERVKEEEEERARAKLSQEQEQAMKRVANNVAKLGGKRMSGYSAKKRKKKKKKAKSDSEAASQAETAAGSNSGGDAPSLLSDGRLDLNLIYSSTEERNQAHLQGYLEDWVSRLAVHVGGDQHNEQGGELAAVPIPVPVPGWRLEKAQHRDPRLGPAGSHLPSFSQQMVQKPSPYAYAIPQWEARAHVNADVDRELQVRLHLLHGGARRAQAPTPTTTQTGGSLNPRRGVARGSNTGLQTESVVSQARSRFAQEGITYNYTAKREDIWGVSSAAQRAVEAAYGVPAGVRAELLEEIDGDDDGGGGGGGGGVVEGGSTASSVLSYDRLPGVDFASSSDLDIPAPSVFGPAPASAPGLSPRSALWQDRVVIADDVLVAAREAMQRSGGGEGEGSGVGGRADMNPAGIVATEAYVDLEESHLASGLRGALHRSHRATVRVPRHTLREPLVMPVPRVLRESEDDDEDENDEVDEAYNAAILDDLAGEEEEANEHEEGYWQDLEGISPRVRNFLLKLGTESVEGGKQQGADPTPKTATAPGAGAGVGQAWEGLDRAVEEEKEGGISADIVALQKADFHKCSPLLALSASVDWADVIKRGRANQLSTLTITSTSAAVATSGDGGGGWRQLEKGEEDKKNYSAKKLPSLPVPPVVMASMDEESHAPKHQLRRRTLLERASGSRASEE